MKQNKNRQDEVQMLSKTKAAEEKENLRFGIVNLTLENRRSGNVHGQNDDTEMEKGLPEQ
eukprot:11352620-Heterocapsa_arctica.AAC.1